MQIDVMVVPQPNQASELAGKRVVVFDILRATSTIITALANKAFEVIPVIEPGEAMELWRGIGSEECLTGGERKGFKIEGFDLGNSPAEYSEDAIAGKKVILCTSNGTRAIKWSQGAAEILVGSFLNLQAIVDYLKETNEDIMLVCSGRGNNIGLEDLACAGAVVKFLQALKSNLELTDAAGLSLLVYEKAEKTGLERFLRETDHGKYLVEIGMAQDIALCAALNRFPVLPKVSDGKITV